ncbi:nuclear transport factor 2 family protein [bacterium]|nr:nuclear transport factor 2 family protein [bacterium]
MEYLNVLAGLQKAMQKPATAELEAEAIARFKRFFADFSPNKIAVLLDETYSADVWFNDTLKTIRGREALRTYLRHSAEAVESCVVDVKETLKNETGDFFVRWVMTIRFKKFKKGQDTQTIGMSHLRFDADGKVCFHQDYWDSTAGIFEHIPVLGWLIAKVKARAIGKRSARLNLACSNERQHLIKR